jgi:hypothetical protein
VSTKSLTSYQPWDRDLCAQPTRVYGRCRVGDDAEAEEDHDEFGGIARTSHCEQQVGSSDSSCFTPRFDGDGGGLSSGAKDLDSDDRDEEA